MPELVMVETVNDHWVPADPARRECVVRITGTGSRKYLTGDPLRVTREDPRQPNTTGDDYTQACDQGSDRTWGGKDSELLASLPRDPGQLNDRLRNDEQRARGPRDPDMMLVENVNLILMSGVVPADLRAALYRTLAMTPGVTIVEQDDNLDGNKGTTSGISRDGHGLELIIDPATGRYIGSRWLMEDSGQPRNTPTRDLVYAYTVVSDPVIVDKVGETR